MPLLPLDVVRRELLGVVVKVRRNLVRRLADLVDDGSALHGLLPPALSRDVASVGT